MREEIAFVTDIHRLQTTDTDTDTDTDYRHRQFSPYIQIYITLTKRPFGWKQPTGLKNTRFASKNLQKFTKIM